MTSRIKRFWSRAELGMRDPVSVSRNITPQNGGVAVHYGGAAQRVTTEAEARDKWLAWQRYHMDGRGWVDVAYTAAFDNWGNVYAGRGLGVRTAANGTNASNQNYVAFVWIGGGTEQPTKEALEALNWLIENARENGAGDRVRPHRDFTGSACPGSILHDRARELDNQSELAPADAPPVVDVPDEPAETRNYVTVGDSGSAVKSWQELLQAWNSRALPRFGADGQFGQETADWTVRFYNEAGLSASDPAAPRVGDKSIDAIKSAIESAKSSARNYVTLGDTGDEVKSWQQQLRKWNSRALPRFGADGQFGAETVNWTVRFLDAVGMSVADRSAPRVGPKTLEAMRKALTAPAFRFRYSATLRRGASGAPVREWQQALRRWDSRALPRFGEDGDFGPETHDWTVRFQRSAGITVDGIVGPQTRSAMRSRI